MLIATAGHIDHGKTTLVRALTGVDTDRLPEEKQRGISIDLGFAHWDLGTGRTIGFVDVPGHERFVRNMLAGVCAVDYVMLVVAADDGVMPQTTEHARIVELMGISRGCIVIAKCDSASAEQRQRARVGIADLIAGTRLADWPIFAVSARTGQGLAALTDAVRASTECEVLPEIRNVHFRLAIDRSFSISGAGTIVTGTVSGGDLVPGTRLIVAPAGTQVRVRGLQSDGKDVSRIEAGQRCAVNLAGINAAAAGRGMWLVSPEMYAPTSRFFAQLKLLPERARPLRHNTTVHCHIGTADITARVLLPRQKALTAGDSALVQVVLDAPVCAISADRFVLRDPSGQETIGGGEVADPFPCVGKGSALQREGIARAMAGDAATALHYLLRMKGHEVNPQQFEQSFNLCSNAAKQLYAAAGAVQLGRSQPLVLLQSRVDRAQAAILHGLTHHHQRHPDARGMKVHEIASLLLEPLSSAALIGIQRRMVDACLLKIDGAFVRLPNHQPSMSGVASDLWRKAQLWLDERGIQAFTAHALKAELNTTDGAVAGLLFTKRQDGDVYRIADDRYMLRQHVLHCAGHAHRLCKELADAGFSAAHFRDHAGISRNLAIQILEFFDARGVTIRYPDNLRTVRGDFELRLG